MPEASESMRARTAGLNEFELLRRGRTAVILLEAFRDEGYRAELEEVRAEWRRRPVGFQARTEAAERSH